MVEAFQGREWVAVVAELTVVVILYDPGVFDSPTPAMPGVGVRTARRLWGFGEKG
jgi:hypothetical protein